MQCNFITGNIFCNRSDLIRVKLNVPLSCTVLRKGSKGTLWECNCMGHYFGDCNHHCQKKFEKNTHFKQFLGDYDECICFTCQ